MKFKKGDAVKVKANMEVEGFEHINFEGWQGWVLEYLDEAEAVEENEIDVEWDSVTLQQMPEDFIIKTLAEDFELSAMVFVEDALEKATPRDKRKDNEAVLKAIETKYQEGDDDWDEFADDDDAFYADLLESKDIKVNPTNLRKYLEYLKGELEMPCIVTGIESMGTFRWEERFNFGGSKKEYEELRKTKPSFQDTYEIVEFLEKDIQEYNAIRVKARRTTDKKEFVIGLDELRSKVETSENDALLEPYSSWYVNYGGV
jgi:hypothetical protein